MLIFLISFLFALAVYVPVALAFGHIAAPIPAFIVWIVALIISSRRVANRVQAEMEAIMPLLQAQKVPEAIKAFRGVQRRWGWWQVMLERQIEAQIGMIDYLQRNWDKARPRLERGQWRNWVAQTALGCIHWRKGQKKKALEWFDKARKTAKKEPIIPLIQATVLYRAGQKDDALEVLNEALKANPDSAPVKQLKATIANRRKVKVKSFPQTWYQFWPEDLGQQAAMRGTRGGPRHGGPPPSRPSRKHLRGK